MNADFRLVSGWRLVQVLTGVAAALLLQSCAPSSDEESCSVTGVTVNIGSTTGGTFTQDLGSQHILEFSNTNLNMAARSSFANYGTLSDVGGTSCLDSINSAPSSGATTVAFVAGHGYVITFPDSTYARFIAGSYSGGVASITYDYPFTPK